MRSPKPVCSWLPISIHSPDRISGRWMIMSSRKASLGSRVSGSGCGSGSTVQMAWVIGMVGSVKFGLRGLHRGALHQDGGELRSEEHTSELQSLMRTSYAVFCFKKKNINY